MKKPFKTTELKKGAAPAFVNGDSPAMTKTLTDPNVSRRALDAIFRDRPSYFVKQRNEDHQPA